MKYKLTVIATVVAISMCSLTSTTLAADSPAPVPLRGQLLQRIAVKLNLTAGQKAQIKAILSGDKDTLAPLLARLHDARTTLRAAIRAGDANETTVRAASAKVAGAEADLAVERMKLYGKISPILTEAQRRRLAEMQQRADEFADNVIMRLGSGLGN